MALCAAGLAAAASAVAVAVNPVVRPHRDTGMAADKLAELRALADRVDVLVVGTSRMLHGFDPRVFESETARLGRPLRAYNLSLQRLLLWEQARVLDDALALPGCKPKLVVIEPAVGLGIAPENFTHSRTIEFETLAAWRLAATAVLDSERAPAHKAWNLAAHTLVAGLHGANYGLYTEAVFPHRPAIKETGRALPPEYRGYLPKSDRLAGESPPPGLVEMGAAYARRFERDAAAAGQLPAAMRAHFAGLQARLARRGIAVVFVQPPQLGFTTAELRELTFAFAPAFAADPAAEAAVLSYLDPRAHAALFDPRWWVDYNHVTATGARLFTAALARDLTRTAAIATLP